MVCVRWQKWVSSLPPVTGWTVRQDTDADMADQKVISLSRAPFPAPKFTDLYRKSRMSTQQ